MAKIAVELERALTRRAVNGTPGRVEPRVLAAGEGWSVADVVCTSGPEDRRFEERHSNIAIVIVTAGSFQYRASARRSNASRELMTPGSLLLGSAGQCFECGHEHGAGDRCISFWYTPDCFERLMVDAGVRDAKSDFRVLRVPPLRLLSPLVAQACAGLAGSADVSWEELSVKLAESTLRLTSDLLPNSHTTTPSTVARVTRAIRMIERHPDAALTLENLAREARLSPYHFLRVFERLTGVTPHQYVLRARLRAAATLLQTKLQTKQMKILDIALDCGFGDVSNFNRGFRSEFGVSPRVFRSQSQQWKMAERKN